MPRSFDDEPDPFAAAAFRDAVRDILASEGRVEFTAEDAPDWVWHWNEARPVARS